MGQGGYEVRVQEKNHNLLTYKWENENTKTMNQGEWPIRWEKMSLDYFAVYPGLQYLNEDDGWSVKPPCYTYEQ